ncbi:MAG: site-specific DNA-methyltransferase, partial [Rubripirellula sp.]
MTEAAGEDGQVARKIDFDLLRQELSDEIVEGPLERYHLNWPGKREAMLAANAPIAKTLRPCREESVDFDTTQNLFIEGDNLEALKLLQETYLGKVKMIYIDPPYNTGSDFIYDDDFAEEAWAYFSRSLQKDESGNNLVANSESNGRFHSDWLSMLFARVKIAKTFLKDDGFLVVSIDDDELQTTRQFLDELFGRQNAIAVLVWDKNRKNDARFFSVGHEYMLVYAKSKQHLLDSGEKLREPKPGIDDAKRLFQRLKRSHGDDWEEIQTAWREHYRGLPDSDESKPLGRFSKVGPRGPYRDDGDISWPGGNGPKYDVLHPVTGKLCKKPRGGWVYPTIDRFNEAVSTGRVVFGEDETTLPRQTRYLFESEGQVMRSVFYSYAQTATVEFVQLMGERVFDNPKNWRDLQRIISYLTDPDDIIFDFFAGSASTAHAVMEQNVLDEGNRRWILVQLAESVDEESVAASEGYQTIDGISRERIRRVADRIRS